MVKALKLEDLSIKQKLGMTHVAYLSGRSSEETFSYIFSLIRNHSLGGLFIRWDTPNLKDVIRRVREVADYPILIMADAETGLWDRFIGCHNAIGCTDSELHAYTFGKVIAVTARNLGYNVLCGPVIDLGPTGSVRMLGADKHKVAKLAAAEARGMHDGGILTVGKHYPSPLFPEDKYIDSHMAVSYSEQTKEELLDYNLYAYLELMKDGLLDGMMTQHCKLVNIDPDAPASMSKKVINIIREQGFDGFLITDALEMMGIRSMYGLEESRGIAVAAGNDLILPFGQKIQHDYEALIAAYENGILTDVRINEAARRVLEAQHKTLRQPLFSQIDEEDIEIFNSINKDSVFAKTDEGMPVSISREGKHFFAFMVPNETEVKAKGQVDLDTFNSDWLYPTKVIRKLNELFPNSKVEALYQFPTPEQNWDILNDSIGYEDVIFLTFTVNHPFVGKEHLTRRIEMLIEAMQYTNRISTVVHFGNPFVLENLPHIPRYILGGLAEACVDACLDVLAGEYPAKGQLTYAVKLN